MFFDWLFRRNTKAPMQDPTVNWPPPMRGDYLVLPFELDWFDWTDSDRAFLTVDGDGTVKLHTWYAHPIGLAWTSLDYIEIGHISSPGANWTNCYWMRPSWYAEMLAQPTLVEEAQYVA